MAMKNLQSKVMMNIVSVQGDNSCFFIRGFKKATCDFGIIL